MLPTAQSLFTPGALVALLALVVLIVVVRRVRGPLPPRPPQGGAPSEGEPRDHSDAA